MIRDDHFGIFVTPLAKEIDVLKTFNGFNNEGNLKAFLTPPKLCCINYLRSCMISGNIFVDKPQIRDVGSISLRELFFLMKKGAFSKNNKGAS